MMHDYGNKLDVWTKKTMTAMMMIAEVVDDIGGGADELQTMAMVMLPVDYKQSPQNTSPCHRGGSTAMMMMLLL